MMLPEHLDVRVSTGHHGRCRVSQHLIERIRRRCGYDVFHVRARRAVEHVQLRCPTKVDLAVSLEAPYEFQFGARQLASAPIDRRDYSRRLGVHLDQLRFEQELIMIAHDAGATEFRQNLDNRVWSWSQIGNVAETNDLM